MLSQMMVFFLILVMLEIMVIWVWLFRLSTNDPLVGLQSPTNLPLNVNGIRSTNQQQQMQNSQSQAQQQQRWRRRKEDRESELKK
jgi:hypothetical protein